MRALLGAIAISIAALMLPLSAQAQQPPSGGIIMIPGGPGGAQIPPHVKACMADMGVYYGFALHRLAGLSRDETKQSLAFSMRILAYRVKQSGRPPLKPIDEVEADSLAKLNEIYDIEPFSDPISQAWASKKMDACIEANAPAETAPPADHQRMVPRRQDQSA